MGDPMHNHVKGLNSPATQTVELTDDPTNDIPGGALRAIHVNTTGTITGWQLHDTLTDPAHEYYVVAGTQPALRLTRIATGANNILGLR